VEIFLEPGTSPPHWFRQAWMGKPQHGQVPTLVARRTVFDRVGLFDSAFEIGEDTDWFARAKDAGVTEALLPDALTRSRVHAASTTYGHEDVRSSLLRVMRASVQRQRGLGDMTGAG
jgi:hypothetical protein